MSGRELGWQQSGVASTCENPNFFVQMKEESVGNNLLDLPSMREISVEVESSPLGNGVQFLVSKLVS